MQLPTWHCQQTVRTLSFAANNFVLHCRVISPTAQQTTEPVADIQRCEHSLTHLMQDKGHSALLLGIACILGLRGQLLQE